MRLSALIGARPHVVITSSFTRYVLKVACGSGADRLRRRPQKLWAKKPLWLQKVLTLKRRW